MSSTRTGAAVLGAAGLAFAAYPALRGYGPETGMLAAELYARPAWLWSHVLGMLGFALLALGLAGVDRLAHRGAVLATALLLPYYGAEAFGLHALGRRSLATGDASAVPAAEAFRYEPVAVTTFAVGLLLLAAVGVRLVVLGARTTGVRRAGAWAVGLALVTYLPQFFSPGEARIGHGLALALGLGLLAVSPRDGRVGAASGTSTAESSRRPGSGQPSRHDVGDSTSVRREDVTTGRS